jgi:dihydroneopterin aldolase
MLVVKLGGSLAKAGALRPWLDALAAWPGPLVVVPGGGAFADTVRGEQTALGYDDVAAHDMSLMAMSQLARAIGSLAPWLASAETEAAIGGRCVFAAWPALRDAPDLPRGWDVTSDSISVVLACRLRAARLLVVKAVEPPTGDAAELARIGLLDPAFPAVLRGFRGTAHITGPTPSAALDTLPGHRLRPSALAA